MPWQHLYCVVHALDLFILCAKDKGHSVFLASPAYLLKVSFWRRSAANWSRLPLIYSYQNLFFISLFCCLLESKEFWCFFLSPSPSFSYLSGLALTLYWNLGLPGSKPSLLVALLSFFFTEQGLLSHGTVCWYGIIYEVTLSHLRNFPLSPSWVLLLPSTFLEECCLWHSRSVGADSSPLSSQRSIWPWSAVLGLALPAPFRSGID